MNKYILPIILAIGVTFSFSAADAVINTHAAAPSLMVLAFAAVIVPVTEVHRLK